MKLFAVISMLAAITPPILAKSEQPAPPAISLPPAKAQVFTLKNGLTIIVEEDHRSPVASVQAWCATGSIHEGDRLGAGLSHILEHMLFKGTDKHPHGAIDHIIQNRGGYVNAYTGFDRTVFWADVPSDGAADAIEVIADAMMNATLPKEEYDKEQEVIRREFAMGFDDPARMSSQLLFRTVFSESPYRHPIIGYLDLYNKLTRDDVMAYYKRRYVPNNLFFVVVGDVDAKKVKEQLETYFEKYPRGALEPVYIPQETPQIGRREAHEEFQTELARLSIAWQIPPVTDRDMPALDVLGTVLGGGASSPLYQEIREKKGLAHSISAGSYALRNGGVFAISAICDPEKRSEVEKESIAVLDRLKTDGISAADLEKAKKSLLSAQLASLTTAQGRASDYGSNWLLTRNLNFSHDYIDALNRVTRDDVQRVAQTYLQPGNVNVTSLNPVGSLSKTALAESAGSKPEIRKMDLPNGLRLLVRENHQLPLVSIVAAFRGGVLAETAENNGISRLLATSMIKGTKTRSAEQIATEIESAGGEIEGASDTASFCVNVSVMKPDLAKGIELLADVLNNPAFNDREVEREKSAQIASIKADEDQMTSVARNLLRQKLFAGHPYSLRTSGSLDAVPKLTPAALKAFHDRYVVARNCVIAVFGDVKADDVRQLVEKYFGAMPPGENAEPLTSAASTPAGDEVVTAGRKKAQAVVFIGYPGVDLKSPDRAPLEVIQSASSDLGSRFFDRIREKLGLAYFVGASQLLGPAPGSFVFYLGTDPAKVERVRTEFKDEIGKLAAEGLTDEELDRGRKKLLGAEALRNQSDSTMAAIVALDELHGLGYDYEDRRRESIKNVTLDDVRRVAKQYFGNPGSVEAIVSPAFIPSQANSPSP